MSLGSENPCVPNQLEAHDEATFDDTRVEDSARRMASQDGGIINLLTSNQNNNSYQKVKQSSHTINLDQDSSAAMGMSGGRQAIDRKAILAEI